MTPIIVPIAFFTMIAIIIIGRPLARAWARRLEAGERAPTLPLDTQARLERMEQAIESIAVEIERLAEGQRFTTRLLAERPGVAASLAASQPPTRDEERQHAR